MLHSTILKSAIANQKATFLNHEDFIHREIIDQKEFQKKITLKEPLIITGVRRCGKSYLLKLIWKHLQTTDSIPNDNMLYINFEHEQLLQFSAQDFDTLLESFFELHSVDSSKTIYLFFDEIQVVEGWEKFIHRLGAEKQYKIIITGSNATLLSKELASSLTGRSVSAQLFPLSFREYVLYKKGHVPDKKDLHATTTRVAMKKLFSQYSMNGGFPAVIAQGYRPLLQEYLQGIIYRDIVLRHRIKYEANLREIVAFITANIGVPLSLKNIATMTHMKNIATVKNYLHYLQETFLFFAVPKQSFSVKEQIYNPDKFYIVDPGMYREVALLNSENRGRVLENIVFLALLFANKTVQYGQKKQECDFVIQDKITKKYNVIQVTETLTDQNKKREIQGLLDAMKQFNLEHGTILTQDQNDVLVTEGKTICIQPVWEWLLFSY